MFSFHGPTDFPPRETCILFNPNSFQSNSNSIFQFELRLVDTFIMSLKIALFWNLFPVWGFEEDSSDSESSSGEDIPLPPPSSQQEALQMVIAKTCRTEVFKDDNGKFLDLSAWTGVDCTDDGFVHNIMWRGVLRTTASAAEIQVDWLPPSVWAFDASDNGLKGSLDFTNLPRDLWRLSLSENRLTGEAELGQLPGKIAFVDIEHNRFSGSANLTLFPETLEKIVIGHNEFSGSIDITLLPKRMGWAYLNNNRFSGPIQFYLLPPALRVLMLQSNQLTGWIALSLMPPYIEFISLADNKFDPGVALLGNIGSYDFLEGIDLRGNNLQAAVTLRGLEVRSDLVWW